MAIIKCPECGHQVSDKAATCPSCGVQIAGRVMKCPECGTVVFKDQELCPNCHYPLHQVHKEDSDVEVVTPTEEEGVDNRGLQTVTVEPDYSGEQSVQPVEVTTDQQPVEGEKTHKKGYVAIVVGVVLVLIVCFVAIYFYKNSQKSNEQDAYTEAMLSQDPSVLQNYLDIYKDAPEEHRDSVEAHLSLLMSTDTDWTNALVSGSKTAIERYLQMHPNSPHASEARIKIDSLDWITASQANTPEAMQAYMDEHSDGLYFDQAKDAFDKLNAQKVSPDDKQNVSALFSGFFNALAANDEDAATANTASVMDSFLQKAGATKNDVIRFMKSLHEKAAGNPVVFRTNNDWKIKKAEAADGGYEYTVSFSVDEKTSSAGNEIAGITTYKVDAKVSSDGKISTLNMKKMVQ